MVGFARLQLYYIIEKGKTMDISNFRKLSIKIMSGSADEMEIEKFNMLITNSSTLKKEYENIKKIWSFDSPSKEIVQLDLEYDWIILNNKLRIMDSKQNHDSIQRKIFVNRFRNLTLPNYSTALLAFFLAVVLTVLLITKFNNIDSKVKMVTLSTSNTANKKFVLPDGSNVILNSGSSIEYNDEFGKENRNIKLGGEAYFSVTKNTTPFIVSTENAQVKVLGTKFNVWARNHNTKVVVQEGIVNLAANSNKNKTVVLTKSHMSKVNNNSLPLNPIAVNGNELLGWLEGKIVFYQSSLDEVKYELERYFNVKIDFELQGDDTQTITGSFDKTNADSILEIICLALDLKLSKDEGNYLLTNQLK